MPSRALGRWKNVAHHALDELESAHMALGGESRGRRYATLQVNHAYTILLSSQFQGFCRDLHTEAIDALVGLIPSMELQQITRNLLIQKRKIDFGNPNPGNLGSDFGRLGMDLWPRVRALDVRNKRRQERLETLNAWRNSVAHQDWTERGPSLRLEDVRVWRRACEGLAKDFDRAVTNHIHAL